MSRVIHATRDHPVGDPSPEAGLSKAERTICQNLAYASRTLSLAGHDDFNQGQVSGRLPKSARFLIKAAMIGFDEASPGDMVVASTDVHAEPDPKAPPELPLHQAIYRAREDVSAIVHTHAPHALVFGATDLSIRPISHEGAFFCDRVPRFVETSHTVLEHDVARAIARCLGDAPALMLRNHGIVVVGRSVREATVAACLLERACQLQLIAESSGAPYHEATPDDVARKRGYIFSPASVRTYWDHCVRRVNRTVQEATRWT